MKATSISPEERIRAAIERKKDKFPSVVSIRPCSFQSDEYEVFFDDTNRWDCYDIEKLLKFPVTGLGKLWVRLKVQR